MFALSANAIGRAAPLAHPKLVEQRPPELVRLVVADAVGDENAVARVGGRHDHGSSDERVLDVGPERVRPRGVRRLERGGALHPRIELRVAVLREVLVGRRPINRVETPCGVRLPEMSNTLTIMESHSGMMHS
jgi:hypothetical protein